MHTENTWECEKSTGMRRKKRRSYEKSERPWTLTEKKEGTHINAHVSVEDWSVNVTSSSLVMWKLLLQNASCGAPDNLGILFCLFPPHHATAKGQQQPFLISVITSEGREGKKNPDRPDVWKPIYTNTDIIWLTFASCLRFSRRSLVSKNLSNNIPSNLPTRCQSHPRSELLKGFRQSWRQARRQTSSVCYSARFSLWNFSKCQSPPGVVYTAPRLW